MRAFIILVLLTAGIGGCAAPIGRNGLPIGPGQAICESFPGTRCCGPARTPPLPQPYCTQTLGVADCWIDPALFANRPPDLGDSPPPAPGCA